MQCANQTFVHTYDGLLASPRKNKSEKNSVEKSHKQAIQSKQVEFSDDCSSVPDREKNSATNGKSRQGRLSEANLEEIEDSDNKTEECTRRRSRTSPEVKDDLRHACPEWILVGIATPNNSFDEEEEASEIKDGSSSVFYTAKAVTDETESPQLSTIEGLLKSENTEVPLCPSDDQTGDEEGRVSGEEKPLKVNDVECGTSESKEEATFSKENSPDNTLGPKHEKEKSVETENETSSASIDDIVKETMDLMTDSDQQPESRADKKCDAQERKELDIETETNTPKEEKLANIQEMENTANDSALQVTPVQDIDMKNQNCKSLSLDYKQNEEQEKVKIVNIKAHLKEESCKIVAEEEPQECSFDNEIPIQVVPKAAESSYGVAETQRTEDQPEVEENSTLPEAEGSENEEEGEEMDHISEDQATTDEQSTKNEDVLLTMSESEARAPTPDEKNKMENNVEEEQKINEQPEMEIFEIIEIIEITPSSKECYPKVRGSGEGKEMGLKPKATEVEVQKEGARGGEATERNGDSWRWINPCPKLLTEEKCLEQFVSQNLGEIETCTKRSVSSEDEASKDKTSDERDASSIDEASPSKDESHSEEAMPSASALSLEDAPVLGEDKSVDVEGPTIIDKSIEELSRRGKVKMGKVGKKILRRKILQQRMRQLTEEDEDFIPCEKNVQKKKDPSNEDCKPHYILAESVEEAETPKESTKKVDFSDEFVNDIHMSEGQDEDQSSSEDSKEEEAQEEIKNTSHNEEENIGDDLSEGSRDEMSFEEDKMDKEDKTPESKDNETLICKEDETSESIEDEVLKNKADETSENKEDETSETKRDESFESKEGETSKGKENEALQNKADDTSENKEDETSESKEDETSDSKKDESLESKEGETSNGKENEALQNKADETSENKEDETSENKEDETPETKRDESFESKEGETSKGEEGETSKDKEDEALQDEADETSENKEDETSESRKDKTSESKKNETSESEKDKISESKEAPQAARDEQEKNKIVKPSDDKSLSENINKAFSSKEVSEESTIEPGVLDKTVMKVEDLKECAEEAEVTDKSSDRIEFSEGRIQEVNISEESVEKIESPEDDKKELSEEKTERNGALVQKAATKAVSEEIQECLEEKEKENNVDVVNALLDNNSSYMNSLTAESYEDIKTFDDDHLPELEVILQEPGKSQTEDAEHETLKSCTKTDVDRSIDDQSSRALVLPILQSTTVFKFMDKKFSKPAESVSEAELKREPKLFGDQNKSSLDGEDNARKELAREIFEKEKRMMDCTLKTAEIICKALFQGYGYGNTGFNQEILWRQKEGRSSDFKLDFWD